MGWGLKGFGAEGVVDFGDGALQSVKGRRTEAEGRRTCRKSRDLIITLCDMASCI